KKESRVPILPQTCSFSALTPIYTHQSTDITCLPPPISHLSHHPSVTIPEWTNGGGVGCPRRCIMVVDDSCIEDTLFDPNHKIQVLVEQTLIRMHRRTKNPGELRFPTQKKTHPGQSFPSVAALNFTLNSTSLMRSCYWTHLKITRTVGLSREFNNQPSPTDLFCHVYFKHGPWEVLTLRIRDLHGQGTIIGVRIEMSGVYQRGSMELQTGKLSVVKPPHQAFCVKLDVVEFDEHVIEVLDFKLFYLQAKLS
ncbi:hypothetical protein M8C21_027694, partial [Ambrosia artemisiifolia]